MNRRFLAIAARGILVAGALGVALWTLPEACQGGDWIVNFPLGVGAVLVAAVLMVPQLAELVGIPIHRLIGSVFWPDVPDMPPANYELARECRQQWRYQDAIAQYLRIVRQHSQALDAYREAIETAFEAKALPIAVKVHRKGMLRLRSKEARAELQRIFEVIMDRNDALLEAEKLRRADPLNRFES